MTDPLSDVLSLIEVDTARCKKLEAGGAWAFRFPAKAAIKFGAVLRGKCWIGLPGETHVLLREGDTFLLANAPIYELTSEPGRQAEDGHVAFDGGRSSFVHHGGDDTLLIGGEFAFQPGAAQILLDALPAFIRIPADTQSAAVLRRTLLDLDAELVGDQIGKSLMTRRLADIALVQVLRVYVEVHGESGTSWIGALTDRRIGNALASLHERPAHRWTVTELAAEAGMSRSGFADRFRELVGSPPLGYLLRLRMEHARKALGRNNVTLRQVSREAGYASESAFGNAFKRTFGCAPRQYFFVAQKENDRQKRKRPGPCGPGLLQF